MDDLDEKLKSLTEVNLPVGVHHTVMRAVHFKKMQPFLWFLLSLLVLNFVLLAFHLNNKLVDAEWLDMATDLFAGFDLSLSFFEMITSSFFEVVSPMLALSLASSFVGFVFITKKTFEEKRLVRFA
jgi:hypothetical protein